MKQLIALYGPVSVTSILRMVVDIGLVLFFGYQIAKQIRGTRAMPIISGMMTLAGAYFIFRLIGLPAVVAVLDWLFLMASVAIPIIFQPELRRWLEQIGIRRILPYTRRFEEATRVDRTIEAILRTTRELRQRRIGGLLIFERTTPLSEYSGRGIKLDANLSSDLLVAIFTPSSPLHDGAVILRGDRVDAAGCWLPLADSDALDHRYGTRHRAAVGITEETDCVAVVISEERGSVALAYEGRLIPDLPEKRLGEILAAIVPVKATSLARKPGLRHSGDVS